MGFLKSIFGDYSSRELKSIYPIVDKIEAMADEYKALTDAELQAKTPEFKTRLQSGETLDDILPEAFATVREASRRVLGLYPYRVQLVGGVVLHQGRIAEMKTGEGKTLVATLPSYLNALTGKSVHVVTVNDYLAKRDAEWMGKVHKFMGLTVGVIVPGMDDDEKREAYKADIVYGTNNEFGFDYLRDNLKTDLSKMVQRDLSFAIVDEVDSILIDEARTPLIISGKGEKSSDLYVQVDKFVRTLSGGFDDELKEEEDEAFRAAREAAKDNKGKKKNKKALAEAAAEDDSEEEEYADYTKMSLEEQANYEAAQEEKRRIAAQNAPEGKKALAKNKDWDYIVNRKDKTVELTDSGAQKAERFFRIDNIAEIAHADLNHHIQQALKAHKLFKRDEDYIVNDGEVIIVDEFTGRLMIGRRYSDGLHQAIEAKEGVEVRSENKTYATITFQNYFRLYGKLSGMTGTAKTEEAEFRTIYSLDVIEIPTNKPIKRVDLPDMVYSTLEGKKRAVVQEIIERNKSGQPVLVGTASVDKSEEISRLLHKNGVKHNILNAKNHEREAEIVAQAGRFGAVTIATNMAGRGTDILLGGNPEYLAKKRLREEGAAHEDIELAVSTYITDVDDKILALRERYKKVYEHYKAETDKEKEQVIAAGGLCIIGTERHESRRIDNQLRGRAGRQGDPGETRFYISLEDDLMRLFGGERVQAAMERMNIDEDMPIESKMLTRSIQQAQTTVESRNFQARKSVLEYDDVMNKQREIIYGQRRQVLEGMDVKDVIMNMMNTSITHLVQNAFSGVQHLDMTSCQELLRQVEGLYFPKYAVRFSQEQLDAMDAQAVTDAFTQAAAGYYQQKEDEFTAPVMREVERVVLLRVVDEYWMEHIDAMSDLRQGIRLRAYAQTDPIIAYKKESLEMFEEMIAAIQDETVRRLYSVRLKKNEEVKRERVANATSESVGGDGTVKKQPRKVKKIGRNEPCPCGSGKKYKNCCGRNA